MTRRSYLFLFLGGLLMAVLAGALERAPGYMDAEYYYAGAQRIAAGQGGSEPYLWNYLNAPAQLPAPSFSYWMPLTSIVSAAGLWIARPLGWWGGRLGFFLLAACIPPLAARLARVFSGKPAYERLAGLLALFPGFYLAYLPTTDAFPIYMVLGGLFFLLAFESGWPWLDRRPVEVRLVGLGLIAGLFHLTRADGLLWLGGALLVGLWWWVQGYKQAGSREAAKLRSRGLFYAIAVIAGYALIMAPWYARNLHAWGSLLPPGGSRTLWITEYEQTMVFPASLLTPEKWLAEGWLAHLSARASALTANLQTTLAVQGGIVLLPFMLVGMWRLRRCPAVQLGAVIWLLTFLIMTIIFPFAGLNGGFFHSGAALQVLLWALAPLGIEVVIQKYAQWRRIANPNNLRRFFIALLGGCCVLLSIFLYSNRVAAWNESTGTYSAIERLLVQNGAQAGEPVLVNDPPGYWLASSGRPAIVVPYGDPSMLIAAASQYGAKYLVLGDHDPWQLLDIYLNRFSEDQIMYLGAEGSTHVYRLVLP